MVAAVAPPNGPTTAQSSSLVRPCQRLSPAVTRVASSNKCRALVSMRPRNAIVNHRHCERSEAIHLLVPLQYGLLRGVYHRARFRATRWLAMTIYLSASITERRANPMTCEVMDSMIGLAQRVASRCAPGSCTSCGEVPRTGTFQISWAYSRMVRSDENHGMRATLRMLARVQAGTTCQRVSMPRWAS